MYHTDGKYTNSDTLNFIIYHVNPILCKVSKLLNCINPDIWISLNKYKFIDTSYRLEIDSIFSYANIKLYDICFLHIIDRISDILQLSLGIHQDDLNSFHYYNCYSKNIHGKKIEIAKLILAPIDADDYLYYSKMIYPDYG